MNEKMTAIKELQQMLRDIAKTDSDIISVIPDGIFGEETEDSVKSFQRKKGQTDTGVVDYELWQAIAAEHKKALFELSDPIRITDIS
ncbi:MAG: peptidoglycan-binding domain-containing protein, partial [Acutalibacteraceae bacterium]|nr:peptidoglycan-binding domain-containing protein [Acutalibacteraceae bacterium]